VAEPDNLNAGVEVVTPADNGSGSEPKKSKKPIFQPYRFETKSIIGSSSE